MPVSGADAAKLIPGIKVVGAPPRRLMNILGDLQAKFLTAYKFKPAFTVTGAGTNWSIEIAAQKMGKKVFADVAALEALIPIRQFEGVLKNVSSLTLVDHPKGAVLTIVMKQEALGV